MSLDKITTTSYHPSSKPESKSKELSITTSEQVRDTQIPVFIAAHMVRIKAKSDGNYEIFNSHKALDQRHFTVCDNHWAIRTEWSQKTWHEAILFLARLEPSQDTPKIKTLRNFINQEIF